MRIGILTLPVKTNYGGILQAYAFQTVLESMGNEVLVINREYNVNSSKKTIQSKICEFLENHYYFFNTRKFIKQNINCTSGLNSNEQLEKCLKTYNLDTIIVGSDQVWRPEYSPNINNYFLDFAEPYNIKRIAYAASFGVDYWQFSEKETQLCSHLAQKFDAIGVREQSGLGLCEDYLGVKAEFVLDPTILLNKEKYHELASNKKGTSTGSLFCYILDMTAKKSEFIKSISDVTKTRPLIYSPHTRMVLWSIGKWLRAFIDAKMIITDSFHGMVFSIIFNKPFWVIGNESRGMTRFHSLLSYLKLEERLVKINDTKKITPTHIDWDAVNNLLEIMRNYSTDFIIKSLY